LKIDFPIKIALILVLSSCTQQTDFPVLKGPCPGQKQPGFAEKIASSKQIKKKWSGLFFSEQRCSIFLAQ
jgi:hypothetical protein